MNQQQEIPPLTVSVICPQLSEQESNMELTIIQDDDFKLVSANDANGNIVFYIREEVHRVNHNRQVLLDATGNPLATLQPKKITKSHKRWKGFKGLKEKSKDNNLLFGTEKPSSSSLEISPKLLEVFLATNDTKDICDFKVTGSWSERLCTFYTGESNIIIAQMTKTTMESKNVAPEKETFTVTVNPRVDYAFIVALIVILDAINDDDKIKRNENKDKDVGSKRKNAKATTNLLSAVVSGITAIGGAFMMGESMKE